jgi:hypothetical protein
LPESCQIVNSLAKAAEQQAVTIQALQGRVKELEDKAAFASAGASTSPWLALAIFLS